MGSFLFDYFYETGRIAYPQFACGHIFRHNAPGPDHGAFADLNPAQDDGSGADAGAPAYDGLLEVVGILLRTGIPVVRECDIRTDEDIVFDPDAIPQLDAALDRDPVSDADVILYETMAADVAVFSDDRLRQYNAILPHPGCLGDYRLAVRQGMYHLMKSKYS
jgi:hypothetical protein